MGFDCVQERYRGGNTSSSRLYFLALSHIFSSGSWGKEWSTKLPWERWNLAGKLFRGQLSIQTGGLKCNWVSSWSTLFVTRLDNQREQVSSQWKGLWDTFTDSTKAPKVTQRNSVKANARGCKFVNQINFINSAGQAGGLHSTVGQELNTNAWSHVAAQTTGTSPQVQTGAHFASHMK